jgi:hypothetical protein
MTNGKNATRECGVCPSLEDDSGKVRCVVNDANMNNPGRPRPGYFNYCNTIAVKHVVISHLQQPRIRCHVSQMYLFFEVPRAPSVRSPYGIPLVRVVPSRIRVSFKAFLLF